MKEPKATSDQARVAGLLLGRDKGTYVLSEALYCAILFLRLAPPAERDVETIQNMTDLYKGHFNQFGEERNPADYRLHQIDKILESLDRDAGGRP